MSLTDNDGILELKEMDNKWIKYHFNFISKDLVLTWAREKMEIPISYIDMRKVTKVLKKKF